MEEIWKSVAGYEGLYEVSNLGRVRSVGKTTRWDAEKIYKREKPHYLSPSPNKTGHLHLVLSKHSKGKPVFVHRLVADAFIPNPNNLPIINHKDENPANNNVTNLEWCTKQYNNTYGTVREKYRITHINHKRLSTPVLCVKEGRVIAEYPSIKEAERATGAFEANILRCCQGLRKSAGGYEWKYKVGRLKPQVINRDYSKTKPYYLKRQAI